MPKVVVMSDIHGNFTALKTVWAEMQQRPPAHTIILGDLVAFGPQPKETLAFIEDQIKPSLILRGNTDRYIVDEVWKGDGEPDLDRELLKSLKWTSKAIGAKGRKYLKALSADTTHVIDEYSLYACHGIPGADDKGFMPETVDDVAPSVEKIDAQVLLCGHTHKPYRTRLHGVEVINVGSIGLPFDRDFRACYLSFLIGDGALREMTFCRVPYNRERTIALLEESDIPGSALTLHRLRTSSMTEPRERKEVAEG